MMAGHVVALCGGVGGAKLANGLAAVLPPEQLTIIVNTGDDFEHLGLSISPDIDTVVYTLAGLADQVRGWGVADESWQALSMLARLGEDDWFRLGDRDLAMHIARSYRLRAGATLSAVTADVAARLGIGPVITPMSDDPVRTRIQTAEGRLDFQRYFVARQCGPPALGIEFAGADRARLSPGFSAALARPDLACLVVCPSNPYLSIDPILAVPGVREALGALRVPRLAVSPIIGGRAVKGPTAKLMAELGAEVSVVGVAKHYLGLIDCLMIDPQDAAYAPVIERLGIVSRTEPSLMTSPKSQAALALACLAAAERGN